MSDVSFYPPPAPGSNAIGLFQIGVSPIGTVPPYDWRSTVISQFANSPVLLSMLESFSECMDQTRNYDAFFDMIWNIDTAAGYGLDVWGRIVGVVRTLQVSQATYFGFKQGVVGTDVFGPGGVSPFFSGQATTSNYVLTDDAYRQLILAKAFANICDCSVPSINQLLMTLFGASGRCYCTDDGGMAMTYTFDFVPSPVQAAIILQSGVLPKPVGVAATVVTP